MTANSHRTLERIADRVPVPEPAYDRLIGRRERKERNRRIRAGTLALVVTVLGAAIFLRAFQSQPTPADPPVQPSPVEHADDHVRERSPIKGLEFPLFAEGGQPSAPITGEAVVEFSSWPHSFPVDMALYADGRVIWHPDQNNVGYFQLRLTPAGVDTIRSMIISTGLFNHDARLKHPGAASRLTIVRGDRSVYVEWGNTSWEEGNNSKAAPSETSPLSEIDRLLSDPSAWQLSSELYADADIRPFVPSGFMFEYDRDGPDLSQFPPSTRDLLAYPASTDCPVVTTDVARRVARALARAGFSPLTNTHVYLDWKLPGESGGPSNPHLNAVLPHELNCDSSE